MEFLVYNGLYFVNNFMVGQITENKVMQHDSGWECKKCPLHHRIIRQLQSVLKTKERIIEQQEEEGRDALKDAQEQIEVIQKFRAYLMLF